MDDTDNTNDAPTIQDHAAIARKAAADIQSSYAAQKGGTKATLISTDKKTGESTTQDLGMTPIPRSEF